MRVKVLTLHAADSGLNPQHHMVPSVTAFNPEHHQTPWGAWDPLAPEDQSSTMSSGLC